MAKRHSNIMPTELRDIYEGQESDLNLRDDVSLVDTRIATLMMDMKNNRPDQRALYAAFSRLERAIISQDDTEITRGVNYMRAILHGGATEKAVWEEIIVLVELRSKLVMEESRRSRSMDNLISSTEVSAIVNRLLSAIELHIQDKIVLRRITDSFKGIVNEKSLTVQS